jgi:hypothetical protein
MTASVVALTACASDAVAPIPMEPATLPDSTTLMIAGLDSIAADVTRQVEALRPTTAPRDQIAALEAYRSELRARADALRNGSGPSFAEVEYDPSDPGLGQTLPQTRTDVNLKALTLDVASAWVLPGILSHTTTLATNVGGLAYTYNFTYKPTSIPIWYLPYRWNLSPRLNCLNDDTGADARTRHSWGGSLKGYGSEFFHKETGDQDACQWQPASVQVDVGRLQLAKGQSTSITVAVKKHNGQYVTDCPIRFSNYPGGTLSVGNGMLTAIESGPMYVSVTATCRGEYDTEIIQILEDCSLDQDLVPSTTCGRTGTRTTGEAVPYDPPEDSGGPTYVCWPVYRWTYLYFPDYPSRSSWSFEYIGDTCQWMEARTAPASTTANAVAPRGDSTVVPDNGRPRLVRLVAEAGLPDGAPVALVPSFERGEDLILVGPKATRFDLAVALQRADSVFATAPAVSNQAEVMRSPVAAHVETRHSAIAGAMLSDLREAVPATRGRLAGRKSIVVGIPKRQRGRTH